MDCAGHCEPAGLDPAQSGQAVSHFIRDVRNLRPDGLSTSGGCGGYGLQLVNEVAAPKPGPVTLPEVVSRLQDHIVRFTAAATTAEKFELDLNEPWSDLARRNSDADPTGRRGLTPIVICGLHGGPAKVFTIALKPAESLLN